MIEIKKMKYNKNSGKKKKGYFGSVLLEKEDISFSKKWAKI